MAHLYLNSALPNPTSPRYLNCQFILPSFIFLSHKMWKFVLIAIYFCLHLYFFHTNWKQTKNAEKTKFVWNWESVSWLCYLTLTLRLNVDSTLLKSKWQENIPDNEIVQYRKHIAVLDIFLSSGLWNKQGGGCIRAWINYPVADHNIIFPSLSFTTRYCSKNICQSIIILFPLVFILLMPM